MAEMREVLSNMLDGMGRTALSILLLESTGQDVSRHKAVLIEQWHLARDMLRLPDPPRRPKEGE